MRNILSRPVVACAVAVCAAAAIPTASAAASTPHAPILIGPNQPFSGYINGHPPGQAVIQTTCAGPVLPGETGNPLPNQTVEVKLGVTSGSTDSGYTGTAANNIRATLGTATGSAPVVIADFTAT